MKQTKLPRWRGFNLLGGFLVNSPGEFPEDDFRFISDWGFDFVRLPLNYTFWIDNDDPFQISEEKLSMIDQALRYGEKYGLHVQMNFHRAPGYSVAEDRKEPFSLWTDDLAKEAFQLHWSTMAKRYKGIASDKLSFNLINEPANVAEDVHNKAITGTLKAIHEIDPERLIILDGMNWGTEPNEGILKAYPSTNVAQSCRSYAPHPFTHYKAEWANPDPKQSVPSWPFQNDRYPEDRWDRDKIFKWFETWATFASEQDVGVHCGEGGVYKHTPHKAVLAWMEDCLDALKTFNIGYALWNLRGPFGVLDSERQDVDYVDFHGHQLDEQMLDLLQKY